MFGFISVHLCPVFSMLFWTHYYKLHHNVLAEQHPFLELCILDLILKAVVWLCLSRTCHGTCLQLLVASLVPVLVPFCCSVKSLSYGYGACQVALGLQQVTPVADFAV